MRKWKFVVPLILLFCLLSGCANPEMQQFLGQLAGAAVDGAVAGLTNTEPTNAFSNLGGQMGYAAGIENQAKQMGVDLHKLPKDWLPTEDATCMRLVKSSNGKICYFFGDDHLAWDPATQSWYAED